MENNKNTPNKNSINANSFDRIYKELFGEYQPDEFSPKAPNKTKKSDVDEGKLFTKFIMKK
jgi:hypothetical protein